MVAAILRPMWPDLPMPVTMTRPRARAIVATAASKGAARSPSMASIRAASPARSLDSVRRAEATAVSVLRCVVPVSRAARLLMVLILALVLALRAGRRASRGGLLARQGAAGDSPLRSLPDVNHAALASINHAARPP